VYSGIASLLFPRGGVIYSWLFKYTQLHTAGFTENNWVLCLLSLILLTGYVGFFFIYVYMIIITMYSIAGMMSSSNAYIIYLLTGYEGIASLLSPRLHHVHLCSSLLSQKNQALMNDWGNSIKMSMRQYSDL
jgi:hypothetical protein